MPPKPTIAILSIGEMGLGIANLLTSHAYPVTTTLASRSPATAARAKSASITLAPTDASLVASAAVLLSIVPPRDALATALRVKAALAASPRAPGAAPLWYFDLNAVSPRSARGIAEALREVQGVVVVDGGIVGGPPKPPPPQDGERGEWMRPSIVVSGPRRVEELEGGAALAEVLGLRYVGDGIGTASGLKMCFASLTKGFTALAVQSFTTAQALGVQGELEGLLREHSPRTGEAAERGLVGMPPKAYRWVAEMRQIAETHREEGGFESRLFDEVAGVYEFIADGTVLGEERTEKRVRGKTPEDVARCVREGLEKRAQQG